MHIYANCTYDCLNFGIDVKRQRKDENVFAANAAGRKIFERFS